MKPIQFKMFLLSVLLLVGYIAAFGQHKPDSLSQYLEIAAKNNPLVLQKFNEYQAALQKVPQIGSLPDPELSLGVFLSPMEVLSGKQVADIRLMQMFPWFGVLKNAKDEMSLMAKAKYESLRDAKLQVFYDVQRTWNELLKNKKYIEISEKNIEILRTLERLSLIKFKTVSTGNSSASTSSPMSSSSTQTNTSTGSQVMNSMGGGSASNSSSTIQSSAMQSTSMGTQSAGSGLAGLYRLQIEIGDLENTIASLKTQQNTIRAKFNSYLNRSASSSVSLPDSIKKDSLNISLQMVSDSMLKNNPMLGMLQYEEQSLDARKKMVSQMGYPMIGVGLNYSIINKSEMSTSSMNGKDMIMPMLTVTLPVYRKKYQASKTETDLLKTATTYGYLATANLLQTEYYEAIQLFDDAERRMKLYAHQSILAKKTFDIMIKSFSVSGTELGDLLRIRQQLLDYESKQVEAVSDFNTAVSWLKRLMANYSNI